MAKSIGKEGLKGLMSSVNMQWSTPDELYDPLNEVFNFSFDAMANDDNHKHESFLTERDNALERNVLGNPVSWVKKVSSKPQGIVIPEPGDPYVAFLNPPYGDQVYDSLQMARAQVNNDSNLAVVALVANRTDTEWYRIWINNSAVFKLELSSRVKFTLPESELLKIELVDPEKAAKLREKSQPGFPSVLAFYGSYQWYKERIYKLFSKGFIVDLHLQRQLSVVNAMAQINSSIK